MFRWFRRIVKKIGIFGVEIEFHPPTDGPAEKPPPAAPPVPVGSTVPAATDPTPPTTSDQGAPLSQLRKLRSANEQLAPDGLPVKSTGRYLLLLATPHIDGDPTPRYVHFSYKRDGGNVAFCIRDFIAGIEWRQGERQFSAADYWRAARDTIICSREEGLFKPIDDGGFWHSELRRRTEELVSARSN